MAPPLNSLPAGTQGQRLIWGRVKPDSAEHTLKAPALFHDVWTGQCPSAERKQTSTLYERRPYTGKKVTPLSPGPRGRGPEKSTQVSAVTRVPLFPPPRPPYTSLSTAAPPSHKGKLVPPVLGAPILRTALGACETGLGKLRAFLLSVGLRLQTSGPKAPSGVRGSGARRPPEGLFGVRAVSGWLFLRHGTRGRRSGHTERRWPWVRGLSSHKGNLRMGGSPLRTRRRGGPNRQELLGPPTSRQG